MLVLIPIFLLSFILYAPVLKFYFFQDDFLILSLGQIKNLSGFFHFFIPRSDVIFYRPISMQFYYFVSQIIFDLNPYFYHLFGFGLHLVNVYLVYILIRKISQNKVLAWLTSFFYATSGVHFMVLSWVAAHHFLFGAFFFLTSFLFFLLGLEKKKNSFYLLSILFFSLGLLSEELVIVLPIVLIFYCFLFWGKRSSWFWKKKFIFLPFFLLIAVYLFIRGILVPIPFSGTYEPRLDLRLVKSLSWLVLWALNVPEEIKQQMISFFQVNPVFIQDFPLIHQRIWQGLWLRITTLFFLPLAFLLKKLFQQKKKQQQFQLLFYNLAFGLFWFLVCLSPVLLFPLHQYPYFLTIAAVGFYFFLISPLAFLAVQTKIKAVFGVFLFTLCSLWFYSSWHSLEFTRQVHWISDRANASKTFITALKEQFPQPQPGTTIVLPLDLDTVEGEILFNVFMDNQVSDIIYPGKQVKLAYKNFNLPGECALLNEQMSLVRAGGGEYNRLDNDYKNCLNNHKIFFLKVAQGWF